MDLMSFMENMGASNIPVIAAFFIGLMTAFSPCPLVTNITAIAFISKKIQDSKHTILVGFIYTFGRMVSYTVLASFIVYVGLNSQGISFFLQGYGEKILGPLLLIIGLVMLEVIRFDLNESDRLRELKERLSGGGYMGAFLLGVIFALSFCPFSAVLYFGLLIPLALNSNDGIILPAVFAFATGLPVMLSSILLVKSVEKLGKSINKVQSIEKVIRKLVAILFILAGLYYLCLTLT